MGAWQDKNGSLAGQKWGLGRTEMRAWQKIICKTPHFSRFSFILVCFLPFLVGFCHISKSNFARQNGIGKLGRWMAAKQSKMEEKQGNMVETNPKCQKTDKNDRKPRKMWSFTNYLLPSSHFCPAKLPFLSYQSPNFVLPSSHFCPAKFPFLSWQDN